MFKFTVIASLLASIALVNGQSIPDVSTIPSVCGTSCADVIEVATLCESQYQNVTDIEACFCNDVPDNDSITSCVTCLDANSASALGTTLSTVGTICTQALDLCAFECDITQCASTDVSCQCGETYLQEIFNCASCNTANGNTNSTTIDNYNELLDSCVNQNFTATPTATQSLPSPTGQSAYVAPTLTNTVSGTTGASSAVSSLSVTGSASTTKIASSVATTSKASTTTKAATTGASGTTSASAAAATTSTGAASTLSTGVWGVLLGLVAVVGLV